MKLLLIIFMVLSVPIAKSESKIKMNYKNKPLIDLIEAYSKGSGQKFVVDPTVKGTISIFIQEPVSTEEAFNQLAAALAVNNYAISKHDDTMIVMPARNIQRDLIEVSSEVPHLKPQRLYTWIYTVKHVPAESIANNLRILMSNSGELSVNAHTNQLIFTDWVSNLNRIAELMKNIDKPLDAETSKIVNSFEKKR